MIFSKDKKPTESGWYWYQPINGTLKPKAVYRARFSDRLYCDGYKNPNVEDLIGLWGDRIEAPSIEAPSESGKAGKE